jgi:hypothetical protein
VYVLGWRWADFVGRQFDKTAEQGKLSFESVAIWDAVARISAGRRLTIQRLP